MNYVSKKPHHIYFHRPIDKLAELYDKKYRNANDDGAAWNALLARADEALANHAN